MKDTKNQFLAISKPAFLYCTMADSVLCDFIWKLQDESGRKLVARICRGNKMRRVKELYDEFAAAFQFPYYFGENWAAFDECLADLSWLPADAYLIVVTRASELLVDEGGTSLDTLIHVLRAVVEGWSGPSSDLATTGRALTPFHILLQMADDGGELLAKLASTGEAAGKIE